MFRDSVIQRNVPKAAGFAGSLGGSGDFVFGGVMIDDVDAYISLPQGGKPNSYFTEGKRLSVAVITPRRVQCKQLKLALAKLKYSEHMTIEMDRRRQKCCRHC